MKGFTLFEVLIVVAIIAILAAIFTGSFIERDEVLKDREILRKTEQKHETSKSR